MSNNRMANAEVRIGILGSALLPSPFDNRMFVGLPFPNDPVKSQAAHPAVDLA
jgi:hypothetical protein